MRRAARSCDRDRKGDEQRAREPHRKSIAPHSLRKRCRDRLAFHKIGALAHVCALVAYVIHWDTLASFSASGGTIRNFLVVFHLAWLVVESYCAAMPIELQQAAVAPAKA